VQYDDNETTEVVFSPANGTTASSRRLSAASRTRFQRIRAVSIVPDSTACNTDFQEPQTYRRNRGQGWRKSFFNWKFGGLPSHAAWAASANDHVSTDAEMTTPILSDRTAENAVLHSALQDSECKVPVISATALQGSVNRASSSSGIEGVHVTSRHPSSPSEPLQATKQGSGAEINGAWTPVKRKPSYGVRVMPPTEGEISRSLLRKPK
jgi:hypothetical protein